MKASMQKLIAMGLCVVLAVGSLTGCGGSSNDAGSASGDGAKTSSSSDKKTFSDLGGMDITVGDWFTSKDTLADRTDEFGKKQNEYWKSIQEKYNFKITRDSVYSYTDAKSDIYSLGVVMYEMVTGKVPFDADTPVSVALKHMQEEPIEPIKLNSRIPVAVNQIILKAMKKDASLRYASATEMIKDLSLALKNPSGKFVQEKNTNDFTRVIPTISENMVNQKQYKENSGRNTKKNEPEKTGLAKYLEENPKMKKVIYIGVPILVVILCILIFWGSLTITQKIFGTGTEQSSGISLISVENVTIDEAKSKLDAAGIKYDIEEVYNKDIEAGKVISQKPAPGTNYDVTKNSPVKLTVSKGAKIVKMPKVKGKKYEEAVEELEKVELIPERIDETSQTVEEGIVTKQDITEGKEVNAGETVKIYVSIGTGLEKVSIPSVTDMDIEQAKKMLTEKKIEVNITYQEDTNKSNGIVLKQSLEVGSVVDEGTAITLTVNKIQEIKEGTVNVNVKSLTGYKPEKDETGAIKKPDNVVIRVTVDDENVYKQSVSADTENINVTIKGKGVVTVKVYVDEVRKENAQIDLNGSNTILDVK